MAIEAITRGDQLFALAATPPPRRDPFWLAPAVEELADRELSRSWLSERSADGAIRCHCEPHEAIELTAANAQLLAPLGVWNAQALAVRAGATIVIVRAWATLEGTRPAPPATVGGWTHLETPPDLSTLLPALTDDAFAVHRARVLAALGL